MQSRCLDGMLKSVPELTTRFKTGGIDDMIGILGNTERKADV